MTAYWVITLLVTVFVTAVFYRVNKKNGSIPSRRKKKADPERAGLAQVLQAMQMLSEQSTDQDEIPGATGEFGYVLSNPIPVNTILGSGIYLDRLRTPDNRTIRYERIGSFASPVSDSPVDGYRIWCNETESVVLYFSCYHKRNSNKLPRNFQW